MYYSHVHRPVDGAQNRRAILAGVFVAALDGLGLPIGPIHVVFPNVDGEHVVQLQFRVLVSAGDYLDVVALKVRHRYVVFARVRPKYFAGFVRYGQGVGPAQVFVDDHFRI